MRIKSFSLLNHKIKVKYVRKVFSGSGEQAYGLCRPEQNEILIATHSPSTNERLPQDFLEHTFYHELVHMLMALMNQGDLFQNEDFIDQLGALLAQFMKTKK